MAQNLKLLALDLGQKKTGLALAEEGFVIGRGVISGWGEWDKLVGDLGKILKEEKIDSLVVGVPKSPSGDAEAEYRLMIGKIKDKFHLKVEEIDETLTSHAARQRVGHDGDDEEAAKIILEDYLEAHR
jgi:putative transcription antitermination factor YqgF